MTFKKVISTSIALCITAILGIAVCGCEDLGAYSDTEEYFASLGDIVLIEGTTKDVDDFSVDEYFYSDESRDNFLVDEDGVYNGVEHSDYVYMAIPFKSDIKIDTLALYLMSKNDVTVYMNVFLTDKIPSEWKSIEDNETVSEESGNDPGEDAGDGSGIVHDDPDSETRIGDVVVHLKAEKWDCFVLDRFLINGLSQESMQIESGQYLLIQFRNNSGVRVFDEEKKAYVDPQTGFELTRAEITMTNLMVRALEVHDPDEAQGGE